MPIEYLIKSSRIGKGTQVKHPEEVLHIVAKILHERGMLMMLGEITIQAIEVKSEGGDHA